MVTTASATRKKIVTAAGSLKTLKFINYPGTYWDYDGRSCTAGARRDLLEYLVPGILLFRGTIVNRICGKHKTLPGVPLAIFTDNIWSYLLWSPVILLAYFVCRCGILTRLDVRELTSHREYRHDTRVRKRFTLKKYIAQRKDC